MLLPWHTHHWQRLIDQWNRLRFANAHLFIGKREHGIELLCHNFIKYALCVNPKKNNNACNQCRSCQCINQENHPDIYYIDELKGEMGIEKIRDLIDWVVTTPQVSSHKFVYIHPIERLPHAASQALLKSLEEAPFYAYYLLVSYNQDKILPTIRSRCQNLLFFPLPNTMIKSYLISKGLSSDHDFFNLFLQRPLLYPSLLETDAYTLLETFFNKIITEDLWSDAMNQLLEQLIFDQSGIGFEVLTLIVQDLINLKLHLSKIHLNFPKFFSWYQKQNRQTEINNLFLQYDKILKTKDLVINDRMAINKSLWIDQWIGTMTGSMYEPTTSR